MTDQIDPELARLVAAHPSIFRGKPPAIASVLSAGWYALVDKLCLDIEGALGAGGLKRFEVLQIKEKFGTLRFYWRYRSPIRRLEGIYDEILIDEVQDLSAHDWDILDALLVCKTDLWMVGDIRQAVLATNARSRRNNMYAYAEAIDWFRSREKMGRLAIEESVTTWRCHPKIAEFSDAVFDASWQFPRTVSKNDNATGHDGVFLVRREHVRAYVDRYRPQCLRYSVSSAKDLPLDFMNFKVSKGATFPRVLIAPTSKIADFISKGTTLEPMAASTFYVAVTRSQQSVAIVLDKPGTSSLPYWAP